MSLRGEAIPSARGQGARRVVILEPDLDGHHAFWLALLIEAHRRAGWAVELVTAAEHSRLRAQAESRGFSLADVRFHAAGADHEAGLLAQARRIAAETGATRILIAFLDAFWPAILAEAKKPVGHVGAKLAGIWFHPYALDAKWRWAPPLGKRWRVRGRVHRFLRSARAAQLFDLLLFPLYEPLARMGVVNPAIRARLLPDPYEREPRLERAEARRALGLPADRTIFLHLGSSERRKGLPDTLAAFQTLAVKFSAGPARRGAPLLLRVGKNDRLRPAERASLDDLRARGLAAVVEDFVPAELLMDYFSASDWVLIPYRKFRYSSGILANAIGAGRPVIAADFGHVGREVAGRGLGRVYPHGDSAAYGETLAAACEEADPSGARAERLRIARAACGAENMLAALAGALTETGGAPSLGT